MKVLIISKRDSEGGAFIAAHRLYKSLREINIDTSMWVDDKTYDDLNIKEPYNKFEKKLARIKPFLVNKLYLKTLSTKNKIIHSPSVIPSFWVKRINESEADIVNLHWIQDEMISIKDISKIKKPIVWTLHDMWAFCGAEHYTNDNRWREGYNSKNRPSHENGFDLNQWTWKRKHKYWKNSFHITTPSVWLTNRVKESKLMHNWPTSVIANPINLEVYKPINKKTARKKIGLPLDVPLVLFGASGGSKDPRKGFDLLVNALENYNKNKKNKKFELAIFGQEKPKRPSNFCVPTHYLGNLNNDLSLCLAYNSADIMVISSRLDNLPNTGLEALACGVPIVAFNTGGLNDIVEHKKTGYLAKTFDILDLAKGIDWVLNNENYPKLSKNARDKSIKEFNSIVVAKKYKDIFEKILN